MNTYYMLKRLKVPAAVLKNCIKLGNFAELLMLNVTIFFLRYILYCMNDISIINVCNDINSCYNSKTLG